jgi:hypothetical protein
MEWQVQNKKERMMVPRHLYPFEILPSDKVISSVGWHHWVSMTLVGSQRSIRTCESPLYQRWNSCVFLNLKE